MVNARVNVPRAKDQLRVHNGVLRQIGVEALPITNTLIVLAVGQVT